MPYGRSQQFDLSPLIRQYEKSLLVKGCNPRKAMHLARKKAWKKAGR